MKKLVVASLASILISGCANVGVLEGSPLGELVKSSNPDDYPSKFERSSLKSGNKEESIYGYNIGEKISRLDILEKVGSYAGRDIYKVKKISKGILADRISSMYLGIEPANNTVELINVTYGKNGQIDGGWLREKLKPILLGSNTAAINTSPKERGVSRYNSINYAGCQEKTIHGLKDGIKCFGKSPEVVVYRDEAGVYYSLDFANNRLVVEGTVNIKNAVEIFGKLNESLIKYDHSGKTYKTSRKVDDNGYVTEFHEYYGLKSNSYYVGANLEASLLGAKIARGKNKSKLTEIELRLNNRNNHGKYNGKDFTLSTIPRDKNTYLDGRRFYSTAIPAILNRDLGCSFSEKILPENYSQDKRYEKIESCDKKNFKYELKITEYERNGRGALAREADYELNATLKVYIK